MTDIFKKQYVFSSRKLSLPNMRENIISGCYIYSNQELNLKEYVTSTKKRVFLLGCAFCTDVAGKGVERDIASFDAHDVVSLTKFWTGRWTLITEDELITDASGLMSAFYGYWDNGDWMISSSPAVIAEIMQKNVLRKAKASGLSWYILPGSIVSDVKTLVCTQKLMFSARGLKICPKKWICDRKAMSTEEKCKAVADMLVCASKNIAMFSEKNVVIALTGGKDSRLTFSALLKSEIPFSAYTAEHSSISTADKNIPRALAERFEKKHIYIKAGKTDSAMREDYDRFCAGNSNGKDAEFYSNSQFSSFSKNTIVIRSGLFEAGQTYARSYTSPDLKGFSEGMASYYGDIKNPGIQRDAFLEWMKLVSENPIDHIDIRDRFYIEQRVGGWAAAIEQSLDINDFTSLQIANCAEILSVLLSCSDEERKNLALSYETIKLLKPEALDFTVNKKSLHDRLLHLKEILKSPVQKLKNYLSKVRR